eukprot:c24547_g1_i1 orf=1007-2269(-)
MVGTACFRLHFRSTCHGLNTVALSKSQYGSPHPYFIQVLSKPHVASPTLFQNRSRSQLYHQAAFNADLCDGVRIPCPVQRSCCHTRLCMERGHELRCATIWHGLLPSHHPSILDQSTLEETPIGTRYPASLPSSFMRKSRQEQVWLDKSLFAVRELHASSNRVTHGATGGLSLPHSSVAGLGMFATAASLVDGSWNVAWDVRPARWLHGRDSAWLLFGVCNCFSTLSCITASSSMLPDVPLHANASDHQHAAMDAPSGSDCAASTPHPQKKTALGYTITGMPSDGRCLFRAIAYGACLRSGKPTSSETLQQELADDLRNKVVDELVSRRSESEWFIEEDFDTYVKRMREPYIWGGEPELLMSSHVLKMPITVHLRDKNSGELISMAEYGKEYGSENPIRVLYHGFGHYDALQIEGEGIHS